MSAAAALLALPACERLGPAADFAANESANQSADATGGKDGGGRARAREAPGGLARQGGGNDLASGAIQASSTTPILNRAYLAGRWTDDGDCDAAAEFGLDGALATMDGRQGQWTLEGDTLTMTIPSGVRTVRIVPVDQNIMDVHNVDGQIGRSTRC